MQQATEQWNQTGRPVRIFTEFDYKTRKRKKGGWKRERRVVAKAEHIDGKENPRFVVTSLSQPEWAANVVYQELYCARGDMENRIFALAQKSSSACSRIESAARRCAPIRCGCICRPWPTCWSVGCGDWD